MTEKQGGSDVRANYHPRILDRRRGNCGGLRAGRSQILCLGTHVRRVHGAGAGARRPDLLSGAAVAPRRHQEPISVAAPEAQDGQHFERHRARPNCAARSRGGSARKARGVRTIIEMVAMTRFDCMVGSSAGQRAAVSQALHHCSIRTAFGKVLNQQPLMRNVLADLVLENEGALALTMRIARAMDNRADPHEDLLVRLAPPVGKYWICKRTPGHAYEAMECIGGSGVMEDGPFPRLFRESPVNAIWEGSGNVQCLDVLRAMRNAPEIDRSVLPGSDKGAGRERPRSIAGSTHCARTSVTTMTSSTAPVTSSTGWRWRSRRRFCCNMRRRT